MTKLMGTAQPGIARCSLTLLALLASHLAVRTQAAAHNEARENDIIVATSPADYETDISIYSPTGIFKNKIRTDLDLFYSGGALGISGNGEFAFLGNSINSKKNKGNLAVVRISGGTPKFLGTFDGGSNLVFEKSSSMASGHVSATGDGYIFAIESIRGPCTKSSLRSAALNIIQLRFVAARDGRNATLFRETSFEAFRDNKCTQTSNAIVGIRSIGNLLYAVIEEKKGVYVMRSFTAFDPHPVRSKPIVTYAKSSIYSVTIDSPSSFIASAKSPDQVPQNVYLPVLIRIARGEEAVVSKDPPGIVKSKFPQFLSGGLSSFVSGNMMGVIAPVGPFSEVPGDSSAGCRTRVYRFNANTLLYDSTLLCLKFKDFLLDLQIVPKSRTLK